MTVTRHRLDGPPDPAERAPIAPKLEARQHRDVLKVLEYLAGRAGQSRVIGQVVAGARVPIGRAYPALDYLVAAGELVRVDHLTRAGGSPAWTRLDPATPRPVVAQDPS